MPSWNQGPLYHVPEDCVMTKSECCVMCLCVYAVKARSFFFFLSFPRNTFYSPSVPCPDAERKGKYSTLGQSMQRPRAPPHPPFLTSLPQSLPLCSRTYHRPSHFDISHFMKSHTTGGLGSYLSCLLFQTQLCK